MAITRLNYTTDIDLGTNSLSLLLGGTSSANALDDYEEGTWTPTNGGNITINSIENADYIKVGNLVTATARLRVDIAVANPVLGGLPFAVSGRQTSIVNDISAFDYYPNQLLSSSVYIYTAQTSGSNKLLFVSATYITS